MANRIETNHRSWLLAVALALAGAVTAGAAPEDAQQAAPGEAPERPPAWALLASLEGTWEGEIEGRLGKGKGVRRYERIMGDRFLLCRHRSVRLPQDKSPQGDRHDELGIFSFDQERGKVVYREFLVEGVVVRSPCEAVANRVVCTSEAVEGSPGTRARLTLDIADPFRFTELYELGFGGREPEHYLTVRWTRSPLPFAWD